MEECRAILIGNTGMAVRDSSTCEIIEAYFANELSEGSNSR
jgi:hypothetical protein